jgi:ubiquinone/menaquinone biosynthesis C-methylase UbiE
MAEVNLLDCLPKTKRDLKHRNEGQTPENIAIAMKFDQEYFDGPREQGYGGYYYDGRWVPVAESIVAHFGLKPGDRIIDIGCAKGFLVKDLMSVCPGIEAFGLDISEYALENCEPEVIGRLHHGSCERLPFPNNSFKAAISINTIHNLDRDGVIRSLREIQRIAGDRCFVQVDSYRTQKEREMFLNWVLTAKFHDWPDGWIRVFKEAGYGGDYYWTITE